MKIAKDMVAVVTGGASGIGLALCDTLAAHGVNLVIADIEASALAIAAERFQSDRVLAVKTDVARLDDLTALRDATLDRFGRVDLLCNNAGIFSRLAPMWTLDIREWKWNIDVNLWGVIHGLNAFLPTLVMQGSGYVVNVASLAGMIAVPGNGPYIAAKHAVVAISEGLKSEFIQAGLDIGVTVVCPGLVATRIQQAARNRPPELAPAGEHSMPGEPLPAPDGRAIPPSQVAAQIVAAVEADRLYCATHADLADMVRARMTPILGDLEEI